MKLLKYFLIPALSIFSLTAKSQQQKEIDKIAASNKVLLEFSKMKEKIPRQLFKIGEGVIIVPKLINAGFVVGGKRGRGIAMIKNADGTWSDPAFITLTGGSIGFQIGVQSVDLILIFKSDETLKKIGDGSFTLGGDASVTAGPLGRNSSASTDAKLDAEIYSYSKSKGLFAGISISGSVIDLDKKAIKSFYSEDIGTDIIFTSSGFATTGTDQLKRTLANLFK